MKLTHVIDLETARHLTANHRGRWDTQKAAQQVRADVGMLAKGCRPLAPPVGINVVLFQRTRRRRDPDNVAGIAKPIIDGIVDAEGIPDDSFRHVCWVMYRVQVDPDVAKGTVRVEVELVEADDEMVAA